MADIDSRYLMILSPRDTDKPKSWKAKKFNGRNLGIKIQNFEEAFDRGKKKGASQEQDLLIQLRIEQAVFSTMLLVNSSLPTPTCASHPAAPSTPLTKETQCTGLSGSRSTLRNSSTPRPARSPTAPDTLVAWLLMLTEPCCTVVSLLIRLILRVQRASSVSCTSVPPWLSSLKMLVVQLSILRWRDCWK